jgi:serine/threonine protein kinase
MITSSGQRLGERYVLQERLAVGGMGEVWSAVDEVLNRPVAVKVLRTDLAPDTAFQARFRAEARTAAALSHGGIAAVYDYGEVLGSAYLVMELVPGEPLSAMIANEGALGTDRTLQIVGQAARALHAAHRHGVIHRDIKPANLMVTPELRVKVTDFGIARPRDHEPLTATGQVMGTAHYLAPELARGEIASPLSDVYALGVVAYECLAGWRPFDGDNQVAVATAHLQDEPPPLPETIPAPVRAIVVAAMAKNPAERPQGANALATLMEDLRLRGLAGGLSDRPPEPLHAWPSDAATPPRGIPARPAQPHATRRSAALDRQLGQPGASRSRDQSQRPGRPGHGDTPRPAPGLPDLSPPPASYKETG